MMTKKHRYMYDYYKKYYKDFLILRKNEGMFVAYGDDAKILAYVTAADLYESDDGPCAFATRQDAVINELAALRVNYILYDIVRYDKGGDELIKKKAFKENRYQEILEIVKDRKPDRALPDKSHIYELKYLVRSTNDTLRCPEWLHVGTKIYKKHTGNGVVINNGLIYEAEFENGTKEKFFYPNIFDQGLMWCP